MVEVDKTHDRAVAFERMQDRLLFRMLRGKAGKRCRRSLYLMNDILAKAQPEHAERIRQQLRVEYGADPLACRDAPVRCIQRRDRPTNLAGADPSEIE